MQMSRRWCVGAGFLFSLLLLAILLAILLAPKAAEAQTFRGTILGTVTDSSGAAIVGAKVAAKNQDTGLERTTETSADGSYAIPELPIGTYDVTVGKSDFQTSITKGVTIEIARDRRVDTTLKPGAITQKVEVSGESLPQVETTNNTLGGSFVTEEVLSLPINGRDFTKLLLMAPGTTGDPSGEVDSPGSFGQFSSNGNRGRSNNFLLDGTDMNDSYRNIPAINQGGVFAIPSTILPVESIAELSVLTNYEAEYGRSSGAVVNIVTKSGTNDIHGSLFEYFRNKVLNARNFFNTSDLPKDAFRNNQFGGAAGGPIIKDKTFWYLAYEGQREGVGLTSVNTVPSLGDYQAAVAAIPGSNPAACATDVFTCVSTQPSGVINPVIVNLYNLCNSKGTCSGGKLPWPLPNHSSSGPEANVSSDDRVRNDLDSVIVKLDHTFTPNETLSGRYFYGRSEQSVPLGAAGGNNLPNTNTFTPTNVNLVSVSLVSVVSTNKVNESRFGFNRFFENFLADDRSVFGNPNSSFGLNTGLGTVTGKINPKDLGLPQMTFSSGLSGLGSSRFSNPRSRIDRNYHFLDNFSWKLSRHDLKFGYEYRHTSVDSLEDLNFRGRLKFADLQNFLEGNLSGGGHINYGDTTRTSLQDSHSLYLQDSFRVTSRLTANLGVRWDYYGIIHEANNLYSSYNPTTGLFTTGSPYNKDLNNFAPRVSLAYDVTGKGRTIVRAGFGVFYDTFSLDFFTGQLYENTNNLGPAYNPIGSKPIFQASTLGSLSNGGNPVFGVSAAELGVATSDASTISNLRTPYIFNYTFNIQRQLLTNTVLQLGYVGTAGRKLQRIRDIGQPSNAAVTAYDVGCTGGVPNVSLTASVAACPAPTFVPRNFNNSASATVLPGQNNNAAIMSALAPQTPFYLQQLETSSRSSYNSLQASLTQHNWHAWTQQINYTWSHSIDDASDGQDYVPHAGQPNDSSNPFKSNRGSSNFDNRHHFVWSATYSFPKWETLGRMGEGWTVSSIVTLVSGHPFEVNETSDDFDGSSEFFGRPDIVAPAKYNYSNPVQFLDLSSFAVPCTLDGTGNSAVNCLSGTRHFGTLGRNALIGPAFRQWDFSLVKNTKLTERYNLQFRTDFYNLLNHPNFSNPLLPSFFDDIGSFPINPVTSRISGFFPITGTVDSAIGNPILGGGSPRSIQFAVKLSF